MLVALGFFAGFVGLLLFLGWAAAESRPAFLDPNTKYPPYVAPITLDGEPRAALARGDGGDRD